MDTWHPEAVVCETHGAALTEGFTPGSTAESRCSFSVHVLRMELERAEGGKGGHRGAGTAARAAWHRARCVRAGSCGTVKTWNPTGTQPSCGFGLGGFAEGVYPGQPCK